MKIFNRVQRQMERRFLKSEFLDLLSVLEGEERNGLPGLPGFQTSFFNVRGILADFDSFSVKELKAALLAEHARMGSRTVIRAAEQRAYEMNVKVAEARVRSLKEAIITRIEAADKMLNSTHPSLKLAQYGHGFKAEIASLSGDSALERDFVHDATTPAGVTYTDVLKRFQALNGNATVVQEACEEMVRKRFAPNKRKIPRTLLDSLSGFQALVRLSATPASGLLPFMEVAPGLYCMLAFELLENSSDFTDVVMINDLSEEKLAALIEAHRDDPSQRLQDLKDVITNN